MGLVDHATFAGAPGGTYHVAVRAVNTAGMSERSSTLTLTVNPTGARGGLPESDRSNNVTTFTLP